MATINLLFPCKKLRRSLRLECKDSKSDLIDTSNYAGPLGYIDMLPLELKFLIFTYLPVVELSCLTITSKSMRNLVELYRNTDRAQKYLLPHPVVHSVIPATELQQACYDQFRKCGLLLKRSTCLYATKDRLNLVQSFMQKYLCSFNKGCQDPFNCTALKCYGTFLHTVIAGWDDKECIRTFETISQNTLMIRHLESIVKYKAGAFSDLEMHVRIFFRRVFLNQCQSKVEKAFWLNLITKPFPMVHQARILFLLYGPICDSEQTAFKLFKDEIQWFELCESTPSNKEQAVVCFGDLASAFRTLHLHSKEWTEDAVISVIDELMSSPEEWLSENIATLLFLCGDCITLKVLTSKAINGRISELSNIIISLCLVCMRQEQPLSWVVSLIKNVCTAMDNSRDRVAFLYGIVDMFKEAVLDVHEFGDAAEDEGARDLQNILDAQAALTKDLIVVAFQSVLHS